MLDGLVVIAAGVADVALSKGIKQKQQKRKFLTFVGLEFIKSRFLKTRFAN